MSETVAQQGGCRVVTPVVRVRVGAVAPSAAGPTGADTRPDTHLEIRLDAAGVPVDGTAVPGEVECEVLEVHAEDVTALRRARPALESLGSCCRLEVRVDGEQAVPGGLRADGTTVRNRRLVSSGHDHARGTVWVAVASPARVGELLGLVLSGGQAAVTHGHRVVLQGTSSGAWVAGVPGAVRVAAPPQDAPPQDAPPQQDDGPASCADLEVSDDHGRVLVRGQSLERPLVLGRTALPPVDTALVNPVGFRPAGAGLIRLLQRRPGHVLARDGQGRDVAGWPLAVGPGDEAVARLRRHRAVVLRDDVELVGEPVLSGTPSPPAEGGDPAGAADPLTVARTAAAVAPTVAALACAGVPLQLPAAVVDGLSALLPAGVVEELRRCSAADHLDEYERESRSVALRRRALRTLSTEAAWASAWAGNEAVRESPLPSASVLLATRRPEDLPQALEQLAAQTHDRLEVVLALHGLPREVVPAPVADLPFELTVLEVPERMPLGAVLTEALLRSGGEVVLKMDDDDWYGPHHVTDLLLALSYSGADVVGTYAELIYLEGLDATVRRQTGPTEAFAQRVSGSTLSAPRRVLLDVGGFVPAPRRVDTLTLDRLVAAGASLYAAHGLGHVVRRRPAGHTWDPGAEYFLRRTTAQWSGLPHLEHVGSDSAAVVAPQVPLTSLDGLALRPVALPAHAG